jgi:glucose-1-phosphate adenylyltransferase
VEYSVLSPGVKVGRGAVVRYSIIMGDVTIEPGAMVDRCIIDKNVVIGRGASVGYGADYTPNNEMQLTTGLTVIGKNTMIPPNIKVGRNVIVGSDLNDDDFTSDMIKSGEMYRVEGTD